MEKTINKCACCSAYEYCDTVVSSVKLCKNKKTK